MTRFSPEFAPIPAPDEPEVQHSHEKEVEEKEPVPGIFARYTAFRKNYPTIHSAAIMTTLLGGLIARDEAKRHLSVPLPEINAPNVVRYIESEPTALESRLEKDVGKPYLLLVQLQKTIEHPSERGEILDLPTQTRVGDFDEPSPLTSLDYKALVQELPKGFQRNINEVSQDHVNHDRLGESARYTENYQDSVTLAEADPVDRTIKIKKVDGLRKMESGFVFNHEVFHLQDWTTNGLLTLQEREELLEQVISRLYSPDRYQSEYVESIRADDEREKLIIKAQEYFAEIGTVYLSGLGHKLAAADRNIIEELIIKMDPEYDQKLSLEKRLDILRDSDESPPPAPIRVGNKKTS